MWKKTFAFAFSAQLLTHIGLHFAMPFLPFFISELGVDDIGQQAFWAGIVLGASGLTFCISAPFWGMLSDRYGRKIMVCRSMFAGTIILLLMSMVRTVGQLVLCRFLQGIFSGSFAANISLVASVTPRKRIGFALGMMQAAVFIGTTIGPLFGGLIADMHGYRAAFRAGAALTLAGALMVLFWVREDFKPPQKDGEKPMGFRKILALQGFLLAVFIMFGVRLSNTMVKPSFPLIVQEIIPSSEHLNSIIGLLVAAAALTGALSAALLGHIGDRTGHKKILVACCLVSAVSSLGHFFAFTLPVLFIARIIFGFAVAGMLPSANAMIHRIINKNSIGKAYGTATSISMTGAALGPFFGGAIARATSLRIPFLAVASAQIILALLIMLSTRTKKAER